MFRSADAVLISKTDLLQVLPEFSVARAETALRGLASRVPLLSVHTRSAGGIQPWLDWGHQQLAGLNESRERGGLSNFSALPEHSHVLMHAHLQQLNPLDEEV